MTAFPRVLLTGLLLLGLPRVLPALDGSENFTLDLPLGANQATPAWLGPPAEPPATFATLDLPITPPDPNAALLVTVYFQEKTGGFLRISWQDAAFTADNPSALPGPGEAAASAVLCDNFYEGIGMSNQRSLLVTAETMKRAGGLVFQCGDSTLGISRIRFEWLQSSTGLSSPVITDTLVTPADGHTRLADDLAGLPAQANEPAWHDRIVDVPITDVPLRIEQGVDFTVQMDGPPALARLAVKESGLPWGSHLVVWINNQRAGVIQPAVPALGDGGYPDDRGGAYVGWREGTFYIPAGLLVPGNDTLQFSAEPDKADAAAADPNVPPAPLAVKDVDLQLDYPANPTTAPATPVPVSDATPAPDSSASSSAAPDPASTPAPNAEHPTLLSLPADSSTSTTP